MGIVYEAEQLEPVHRRVALKMVRAGMDTGEVLARFEAERQALAVMDHPGIARVLDAGAAEQGRPYFVMELVKGVELTEYCDANRLTIRERVTLLVAICRAVQHAHQKGVIHRDLKPSNILVTEQGGPQPKIIDFGVAKALSQRLTERTLVTAFGQSMGTPAYMSPEQAEASGLDVDTRADIYSLGVIAYELLVGRLPVDPEELGLPNFILALTGRGNDPPRPGTRLTQMKQAASSIAALRRTDPSHLRKEMKGDLEWIVMKAIEKDRGRRYDTANAFAMDLERYLADEPVVARPPSARYRLGKLVRRNKVAAAALALVVVSIVAGGSLAAVGFVRARRAEAQARRDAQVAAKTSDFLVRLFSVADPLGHREVTLQQVLDSGAVRIDRELMTEPIVRSRLLRTMGVVYTNLGKFDRAEPLLRQALKLRRTTQPLDSSALAESYLDLGKLLAQKGAFGDADSALTASIAIREHLTGLSDSVVAAGEYELGRLAYMQGDGKLAEQRERAAFARLMRSGDSNSVFALNARNMLGITLIVQRKYDSAAAELRAVIAGAEPQLGFRSGTVLSAYQNLAVAEYRLKHYDEAESLLLKLQPVVREMYGSGSSRYATVISNLGLTYIKQHRWREAEPLMLETLAIDDRTLDPGSPDRAADLKGLAAVDAATGRLAAADSLYRLTLSIETHALPPDSPAIRETREAYAPVLRARGKVKEAVAMEAAAASGEEE